MIGYKLSGIGNQEFSKKFGNFEMWEQDGNCKDFEDETIIWMVKGVKQTPSTWRRKLVWYI